MCNDLNKKEMMEFLSDENFSLSDSVKKFNIPRPSNSITFSKNVFLPLTHICRNNCGYCTFRQEIDEADFLLMNKNEVFSQLQKAKQFNCTEALYAFGESADEYDEILNELNRNGFESMVDYVYYLSHKTLNDYSILPHTNMGLLSRKNLKLLSSVNASMGLMLETTNKKLLKTIVHKNSPGKNPDKRIKFIENAGREKIPFTTGLLVGIGESLKDRVDSLCKIRKIQNRYGHIQEIIIQNFKTKENIAMRDYPEPKTDELLKLTILASKLFPDVSIQIPPNLNDNQLLDFISCGAHDLGGISPVTVDYINPEDKWPQIERLDDELKRMNYRLTERLPVYDKFINEEFLSSEVYEKAVMLQKTL